jgi:4-deoxy-L-threo-5-hexosulose-uronate ketol-isomerase
MHQIETITVGQFMPHTRKRYVNLSPEWTNFKPGSIWNTMPAHLHDRRMEAYFYFDLPETQRVIHFMGEPHETRHLFLNNEQGIVSPSWSIHSGVATASYSFIWAMAGENMSFADMDFVNIQLLK